MSAYNFFKWQDQSGSLVVSGGFDSDEEAVYFLEQFPTGLYSIEAKEGSAYRVVLHNESVETSATDYPVPPAIPAPVPEAVKSSPWWARIFGG